MTDKNPACFPVTHSVLCPQALQSIIEKEYDIPDIRQLSYFQAGLNDTYILNTSNTKYILRAYRKNWRTESDICCEIDLLNFLQNKNIPVSAPLSRKDGEYLTRINAPEGLRYVVLFSFIQGTTPAYKDNYRQEASTYGRAFGKLHHAMKDFSSPHQRIKLDLSYLLHKPLESIYPFIKHHKANWIFLSELSENLSEQYHQLARNSLQQGFCHGDLNSENVHIQNQKIGIFDFDCCGHGYYAADIAAFRWGVSINTHQHKLWPLFLDAYLKENALNDIDIKSVSLFTLMRHIWHMGLHIQLSKDRGLHWINDNYFNRQIQLLKSWQPG